MPLSTTIIYVGKWDAYFLLDCRLIRRRLRALNHEDFQFASKRVAEPASSDISWSIPRRCNLQKIFDSGATLRFILKLGKRNKLEMGNKERSKERRENRRQEISLLRTIPYSDHQRWWSSSTIALVTGANRGIGFEITKQLAEHGLTVILASREAKSGDEAAKLLQELGLNVRPRQLDVLDSSSIEKLVQWIRDEFTGIDILVNNAGVNHNLESKNSVEFAHNVLATNYYGTKNVTEAMISIMKPSAAGARIINVTSRLGKLNGRRNRLGDTALRAKLADAETLSEELIDKTVSSFLRQVDDGKWEYGGWPETFTDYSVSKLAVNAFTRYMARKLSDRPEGEKIYINCYCPGWVKTAMTGWAGNVSVEDGADTGVWLALLPADQNVTGKFFAERREIRF